MNCGEGEEVVFCRLRINSMTLLAELLLVNESAIAKARVSPAVREGMTRISYCFLW